MTNKSKPVIFLPGASGSMGFETFKLLWRNRDQYDLVLLQRPSQSNKKLFLEYEREAGIIPVKGAGVVTGDGLKIIWGDATNPAHVKEACKGIDWCLCCLALISPEADRRPEEAFRVNTMAIQYIVEAIEAEDPENIKMVYIGTIAEYGDRLPPVHTGRVGDPVIPSVFDMYAHSKIQGELAVMGSRIRHWVSLRQTFIMIPDLFSLMDPIMFHQPLNSFMENITARDSGRVMVDCLQIPDESDFWRGCYNISGGQTCRVTFLEFLDRIYNMIGLDYRRVMKRNWFALKNFHMQFFEDAHILNRYLGHWDGGQSMEDYFTDVWNTFPWYLKMVSWMNKKIPPFRWIVEGATKMQLRRLTRHQKDGTMHWFTSGEEDKIRAFFGSTEAYLKIPGWNVDMPSLDHGMDFIRLDHGYDEKKKRLSQKDLQDAAAFRGGKLLTGYWNGDMHEKLEWTCCQEHTFQSTPYAVLKAGHWCVDCISPPWNYDLIAAKSPFFRQILKE
jgi:nucleoside-diphosphate-sugar epimerase